jgi:hypothetical protein
MLLDKYTTSSSTVFEELTRTYVLLMATEEPRVLFGFADVRSRLCISMALATYCENCHIRGSISSTVESMPIAFRKWGTCIVVVVVGTRLGCDVN